MTDHIRRVCSAILEWGRLRPPQGHMEMLREEVGRREDERLARGVATEQRHARASARAADGED